MNTSKKRNNSLRNFCSEYSLLATYLIVHKLIPYTFLDDLLYIKFKFSQIFRYTLNLRNPKTYNEKLQWLKLYDRRPLYTQLADKYRVRDYIAQKVGEKYLPQLYGAYRSSQEIDWEHLPHKFVLKTNNGCKSNIICLDKSRLNTSEACRKLDNWLLVNNYQHAREWPYKDIDPLIICEEYLPGDDRWGLLDYKWFCFNGKPVYIVVDMDRFTRHNQAFYDLDWVKQPWEHHIPYSSKTALKPENFDEMREIAAALSEDIPFMRVDMYNFASKIYCGELTLSPGAGFQQIEPFRYDQMMGELIQLPTKWNNQRTNPASPLNT